MQFKKGSPYRQMFSGKQCSGGTPPSFIRDAVSRVGDGFLQEHWVHSSGYADHHRGKHSTLPVAPRQPQTIHTNEHGCIPIKIYGHQSTNFMKFSHIIKYIF